MFSAADYGLDAVEVWPENWLAWRLFCDVATQWRTGVNGPTGLDYGPLMRLLDLEKLSAEDWRDTFDCVRACEGAALDQIRLNAAD